jgi:hypothetical protein
MQPELVASLHEFVRWIHSGLTVVGPGVFADTAADRFAFDLFYLPFIHSSTAPNRAKISFISACLGSSWGFTSNGSTCLLPF